MSVVEESIHLHESVKAAAFISANIPGHTHIFTQSSLYPSKTYASASPAAQLPIQSEQLVESYVIPACS